MQGQASQQPKEQDYAQRTEMGSLGHNYLGNDGQQQHFVHDYQPDADYTPDQRHDVEQGYEMDRTDSRTRLHLPHVHSAQEDGGYSQLPPGADGGVVHGRVPGGQPVVQHVQYPPITPAPPAPIPDNEHFHTVPLNDTPRSGSMSPPQYKKGGVLGLFGGGSDSSTPTVTSPTEKQKTRPKHPRHGSWDRLQNNDWDDYNPATAKKAGLRFAQGDAGTNSFSRCYLWLLNRGIVARWIVFIVPVLIVIWIPGVIDLAGVKGAKIWSVPMLWWSIWLTVVWCTLWGAKAFFMMFPSIYKQTICTIIPNALRYTGVVANLGKYAKFIVWAVINWVSYQPLIQSWARRNEASYPSAIDTVLKVLLAIIFCFVALGIEKLVVQLIALAFHRDAYADRIAEQKWQIKVLTTLYQNSHDVPGRNDTLRDNASTTTKANQLPKIAIRKALRGLKSAAASTTTALGNVASEMAGTSVLQTNSPHNKVTTAIQSANKSRALARRLFYSFRSPGADHLTLANIARFFPDLDTAKAAFEFFDRDGNGDATRDEVDTAILDLHRDRLSLEASIRDLDGAVSRLDDILLGVVFVIWIILIAALVFSSTTSFITGMGSFVLSMSWMIGTTMQEILLSCIFVFVKHPYDVGDRVMIGDETLTVVKVELLSTTFKRSDGMSSWCGHSVLWTKTINNLRRSGPTSETYQFSVGFDTSFEQLQALRAKMLEFVKDNARDYIPAFDVTVFDLPGQTSMVLKADINFKSNWQQGSVKTSRRNRWICQLKMLLAELQIWGPAGAGNPNPDPADPVRYTEVPWNDVKAAAERDATRSPPPTFQSATSMANNLSHRRADSSLDLFGESLPPSRGNSPGPNHALLPTSGSPLASSSQTQLPRGGQDANLTRRPIDTVQTTGAPQYGNRL